MVVVLSLLPALVLSMHFIVVVVVVHLLLLLLTDVAYAGCWVAVPSWRGGDVLGVDGWKHHASKKKR